MKKFKTALLLTGVCMVVSACSGATDSENQSSAKIVLPDDPAYKNVYSKSTCVMCHGTDLKGGSAPALLGVGKNYDKAGIMNIIKNGQGMMSAQYDANISQGLTDADLNAMAEWLSKQK